ncbi:MAG: NFACT RNA binding domain-containing protein [Candidatus Pacearchaeota archaeon]
METSYRKSVFFVVYKKNKQGNFNYLVLKRSLHWTGWEFPKGGVEQNESELEAVKREVKEETGQEPHNIQNHYHEGKYEYTKDFEGRDYFGQKFSLYSVEISSKDVKIDETEHSKYLLLAFDEAYKKLTWPNQKKSLEIVDSKLKEQMAFRKFQTSNRILVLSGKDRENNEKLVNQIHPEEHVFHTEKPGSPFVNIKTPEVSEKDIQETATFCAAKSQDWRDSKSDVKVSHFKGKDIYKEKNMKTGTFGINNKEEILIKKKDIEEMEEKIE